MSCCLLVKHTASYNCTETLLSGSKQTEHFFWLQTLSLTPHHRHSTAHCHSAQSGTVIYTLCAKRCFFLAFHTFAFQCGGSSSMFRRHLSSFWQFDVLAFSVLCLVCCRCPLICSAPAVSYLAFVYVVGFFRRSFFLRSRVCVLFSPFVVLCRWRCCL